MKRIALPRRTSAEGGFTLTEVIVGLMVASMLVVGLADITRRYAQTAVRVKDAAADIRAARILSGLFRVLERVDPGSLSVDVDKIEARVGGVDVSAILAPPHAGVRDFEWWFGNGRRALKLKATAHFEMTSYGSVVLLTAPGEAPLAMATPARTATFDCEFDTVSRGCQ